MNIFERSPSGHRRSIRLPGYDYTRPGFYFVTLCSFERRCIFGEIAAESLLPSGWGDVAIACWRRIPARFSHVRLDEFVLMPNHLHGLLCLVDRVSAVGAQRSCALRSSDRPNVVPGSLGAIVRSFKAQVVDELRSTGWDKAQPVWQRGYYERVVRTEDELRRARAYIRDNPLRWSWDQDHPT